MALATIPPTTSTILSLSSPSSIYYLSIYIYHLSIYLFIYLSISVIEGLLYQRRYAVLTEDYFLYYLGTPCRRLTHIDTAIDAAIHIDTAAGALL